MTIEPDDTGRARPYDLTKHDELRRLNLNLELESYLRVSLNDGTDRSGRRYAFDALRKLNGTDKEDRATERGKAS